LYRVGETGEAGVLALMPANGVVMVRPPAMASHINPPLPGYVLVEARLWIAATYMQTAAGSDGYVLNNSGTLQDACWQLPVKGGDKRTNCGTLNPMTSGSYQLTQKPADSGDWRQVSLWAWMKLENIGK